MAVNLGFLGFMPPPTDALKQYARQLYDRRGEGIVVARQLVEVAGWRPDPSECHSNAVTLESKNLGYKAVHGWLYFDFGGGLAYVRFAAHSVVEDKHGDLIDITPLVRDADQYPFIRSNLSEEQFKGVISGLAAAHPLTNLDHVRAVGA